MKPYKALSAELRDLYISDEGNVAIDAVWNLKEEWAPQLRSSSQESRDKTSAFWAEVADWASRLSVAATFCGDDK